MVRQTGVRTIRIDGRAALLERPRGARHLLVLAHGAGAGMRHAFMATLAAALAERGIATLRWEFPYMAAGSKRVDRADVAEAAVRTAVAAAARDLHVFAGGKSFGGRMTSQAQAKAPLPRVAGLVFLGFPLHPAGRPSIERGDHLDAVSCPMLFVQGSRDDLADIALVDSLIARLGTRATLALFDDADHAFHVRARSGSNDAEVLERILDTTVMWIDRVAGAASSPQPLGGGSSP